ncbi:MAG: Ribosome-recycling factor [Candidatus Jorgensenbacteria bacterium GW2011_GWA1_48_11]|uniref:Ribosome-recycling factor n=1 Tax=Candidatus Jorgensenbacteria bacterium GW2011_GWA1_48_11 TaxID=1618660 RepID=A0A0G1UAF9_9BACT|nr:MAG: Ribosome-recycling factor [Candidatus Jorgensenbacteria bacterium GW2011_GWA1_48_11]KKW11842.1 MAG: Ribosome-recycling factor [Candidatus Jorgensenbacteria bacterium GW2011_GWB1_49_9]
MIEEFKKQFNKVFENFKKELAGVRTNRPSAALVEDLKVEYYNQIMPLKAIASVGILPPRGIQIQAWDKEALGPIQKAIEKSSLNLTASQDGSVIRINLPELSAERREELIKHVKKLAESERIQLRHYRDDANKEIQKDFDSHEINEDQKFKLKEEIQKAVDKTNESIEAALAVKIKEIQT